MPKTTDRQEDRELRPEDRPEENRDDLFEPDLDQADDTLEEEDDDEEEEDDGGIGVDIDLDDVE